MEGKKLGNYILTTELGRGQFGSVFHAVSCESPGKEFAVKCVSKTRLRARRKLEQLFESEVQVMALLNHPNVMKLHELLETDDDFFMVMDFCNKGDLEAHLHRYSRLSEPEAIYFFKQIMNGFMALHEAKVMHRDVKLPNFFLHDDRVIIGDFGFAKMGPEFTDTQLGSPLTMAPELYDSGTPYTSKADLWSLGVCLYQLLFGAYPFNGRNEETLRENVFANAGDNLRFPPEPGISESCCQLIRSLLQPDPLRRIEWANFFCHPVFDKTESSYCSAPRRSVPLTPLVAEVEKEFLKNREKRPDPLVLVEPLVETPSTLQATQVNPSALESPCERKIFADAAHSFAVSRGQQRLMHEKRVVIFHMHAARRLRDLTKRVTLAPSTRTTMMEALLLCIRRGQLLNRRVLTALEAKKPAFGLSDFPLFCESELVKTKLLPAFQRDDKNYSFFFEQMTDSFSVSSAYKPLREAIDRLPEPETEAAALISPMIAAHFKSLRLEAIRLHQEEGPCVEFLLAVLHLGLTLKLANTLELDSECFMWVDFEEKNGTKFAFEALSRFEL